MYEGKSGDKYNYFYNSMNKHTRDLSNGLNYAGTNWLASLILTTEQQEVNRFLDLYKTDRKERDKVVWNIFGNARWVPRAKDSNDVVVVSEDLIHRPPIKTEVDLSRRNSFNLIIYGDLSSVFDSGRVMATIKTKRADERFQPTKTVIRKDMT